MEIKLPLIIVSGEGIAANAQPSPTILLRQSRNKFVWLANNSRNLANCNVKYSKGISYDPVSRTSLVGSFRSLSRNELAFFDVAIIIVKISR